jgi:hypothetical protein
LPVYIQKSNAAAGTYSADFAPVRLMLSDAVFPGKHDPRRARNHISLEDESFLIGKSKIIFRS